MEKKVILLTVVMGVICLFGSEVFALDVLGPPANCLTPGQTSVGLSYLSGQMDLDVKHLKAGSSTYPRGTFDGVKLQRAFVDVSHGLADNIDIFGRIGGSRLEIHENTWFTGNDYIFDGDMGLSVGGGLRGTIFEQDSTKFGGVAAVNWTTTEDKRDPIFSSALTSAKINYYEILLAIGAVHPLAENVKVYGGPFFIWFNGDLKGKGMSGPVRVRGDLEESGNVGGYLGVLLEITESYSVAAECQLANGSSGFGVNAVLKLK